MPSVVQAQGLACNAKKMLA